MSIKYGNLVQFDPIEEIIKLQKTGEEHVAQNLVRTYVISEHMADRLTNIVFPQLQFESPANNKSLLFVGNYGTGKSHLMSVVTAIAEYGHLVDDLRHPGVRASAEQIAGKFKVIRTELGHTTMSLRDALVQQLEQGLAAMGVNYTFPATDKRSNHLPSFQEMMAAFDQEFPGYGLLLAVDELLDYLRERRGQLLIGDFQFLREVGEACKHLRFRFLAGAQEAIFDSSTFEAVADDLRRVKARFEQVLLVKGDLKFVAAERLLKKTPAQQVQVRNHLLQFAKFYGDMNERMDEFVQLYPIHPNYIDTFEELRVVEQREVLKVLSRSLTQLLHQECPTDEPGLFSYERYWETMVSDATLRNHPDIKDVLDRVQVLEQRIRIGAPPDMREMALQIIRALAIHRLTTGDLKLKIGPTAQELRDTLCLFDPTIEDLGGDPAEDLLTHIETVINMIIRTVNGQFIAHTEANGQYYLDLAKDIDYDAQIDRRAEVVGNEKLDEAYYDVLIDLLELPATRYKNTHLAWQYELTWLERRAPRDGYLFFGTPHERSTAQPERDFYMYFVQPWDEPKPQFVDEQKREELFFRLTNTDESFMRLLKRCAAAGDLAANASGAHKAVYLGKQEEFRGQLKKWLGPRLTTSLSITYRGTTKPLGDWVKGIKPSAGMSFDTSRDLMESVSAICFADYFLQEAPNYPTFPVRITKNNREEGIRSALKWIAGTTKSTLGAQVLDGLQLLHEDHLDPERSPYAIFIRERLATRPNGTVLNREALFEDGYLAPSNFRLEPDLTFVVLATLVYSGHVVLNTSGKRYEVGDLPLLASGPLSELVEGWTHIQLPQDWNLPALKALFQLLGLAPALALDLTKGGTPAAEAIEALHVKRLQLVNQIIMTLGTVNDGLPVWNLTLLNATEVKETGSRLSDLQQFLERLQSFNVPARFKGDRVKEAEVVSHQPTLRELKELQVLIDLVTDLNPLVNYLSVAMQILPADHNWVKLVQDVRSDLTVKFLDPTTRNLPSFRHQVKGQLLELKKRYFDAYALLHVAHRLDLAGEVRKQQLTQDPVLNQLEALAEIPVVVPDLRAFKLRLQSLEGCNELTEKVLEVQPVCSCAFKPVSLQSAATAAVALKELEEQVEQLHLHALQSLQSLLADPTLVNSKALKHSELALIQEFNTTGQLPNPITTEFVAMVKNVLGGLTSVVVSGDQLRGALLKGGSPASKAELLTRFEAYLAELALNQEPDKIRFVLD